MEVTVQDVMTQSPTAVPAETPIGEVLTTLVTEGLPSVYITTGQNRLAGIVTDYEILKHQVLGGDRTLAVETLMSRTVPTIRSHENAMSVCPQFRDGRLSRMAVVDDEGRLIGNLSRCDVLRMIVAREQLECDGPASAKAANEQRRTAPGTVATPRGARAARAIPAAVCR